MITAIRVVVLVLAAALINSSCAQAPDTKGANSNAMCIERMDLPSYPLVAQQARIAGTITAKVVLSPTASVQDINVRHDPKLSASGSAVLENPVLDSIRRAAFDRGCGSRTVSLVFVFELAGTSMGHPKQTFGFGSPNKFWIRSEAPHWQP